MESNKPVGRPKNVYKYIDENGKQIPALQYYKLQRALKRQAGQAKSTNKFVSDFGSKKIKMLVDLRNQIEQIINFELQSLQIR